MKKSLLFLSILCTINLNASKYSFWQKLAIDFFPRTIELQTFAEYTSPLAQIVKNEKNNDLNKTEKEFDIHFKKRNRKEITYVMGYSAIASLLLAMHNDFSPDKMPNIWDLIDKDPIKRDHLTNEILAIEIKARLLELEINKIKRNIKSTIKIAAFCYILHKVIKYAFKKLQPNLLESQFIDHVRFLQKMHVEYQNNQDIYKSDTANLHDIIQAINTAEELYQESTGCFHKNSRHEYAYQDLRAIAVHYSQK